LTKTNQKKLCHVGHDQSSSGVVQIALLEGGDGTDPGKHTYKWTFLITHMTLQIFVILC